MTDSKYVIKASDDFFLVYIHVTSSKNLGCWAKGGTVIVESHASYITREHIRIIRVFPYVQMCFRDALFD